MYHENDDAGASTPASCFQGKNSGAPGIPQAGPSVARLTRAGAGATFRMDLQYDGTGLHGWAKQKGLLTVEGALEEAFRAVLGFAPRLCVAGRTDAGVHARRQVASFQLPEGTATSSLIRALNALTPPGIVVVGLSPAPVGFNARKQAASRTYRYFVSTGAVVSPFWSRYCWHVYGDLDRCALKRAAAALEGCHDFIAFTPMVTEHRFFCRLVKSCTWGLSGDVDLDGVIFLEIEADAFLRHMVRTLIGTMVEVGRGARSHGSFLELLKGASRDQAGPTAPAQGLFFWDIAYPCPSPPG